MHRRKFMRGAALLGTAGFVPQLLNAQSPRTSVEGDNPHKQSPSLTSGEPLTDAEALVWAKSNIQNKRRSTANLVLTDRAGNPLKGLKVKVKQTSSSFLFGDQNYALDNAAQNGEWHSLKSEAIREVYSGLFNGINNTCYWTERSNNSMKRVEEHQGDTRLESFSTVVDWAVSNGITCKGHPIFWPVDKAIPKWLRHYDYDTQLKFLEVRVRSLVSRFRGKVQLWDMVNEMMWEPALKNINQRNWPHLETEANLVEYISLIVKWATDENPSATFLLNEYGIENNEKINLSDQYGTPVTAASQRKRYLSLVKALKAAGTPVGGIGLQSHSGKMLSPLQQYHIYQEIATAGLPIHITEFWVPTIAGHEPSADDQKDKAKQEEVAASVADYVTMAYGHPEVGAFFGWGLTKHCYKVDDNGSYNLFATYHKLQDLTQKEWRTSLDLTTDSGGMISLTGFEGQYEITFLNGKTNNALKFEHRSGIKQQQLTLPIS